MAETVLLIDDDPSLLMLVERELDVEGIPTISATTGKLGLETLREHAPAAIVLDLGLPDLPGEEVLQVIRKERPNTPVVILTAHGGVDAVVRCMREGALDFVQKPFERTRLVTSVRNALEHSRLHRRLQSLTAELRRGDGLDSIIGESAAMQACRTTLARAAQSNVSVLLRGESGTGKEVATRALHAEGSRSSGPLIAVNCGAIPEGLVESQLFGHKKGAFTGATGDHQGFFEQADGGTIFLDEVGELPLDMQVKLLRVLQERVVQRVGSTKTQEVDVRVVAATNLDLEKAIEEGTFRSDLFYRLAVFPITLPPLRDRESDVVLLANVFMQRSRERHARPAMSLSQDAEAALTAYAWPGNVRELENVMERAVILEDSAQIGLGSLPEVVVCSLDGPASDEPAAAPATPATDSGGSLSLVENERHLIEQALQRAEGNVSAAASLLEIGRATLYRRIERHGLQSYLRRGRRTDDSSKSQNET